MQDPIVETNVEQPTSNVEIVERVVSTTEGPRVERVAPSENRPDHINNRRVYWVEIDDDFYGIFAEPIYRDKMFVNDHFFKYDMDMKQQGDDIVPEFKGYTSKPREFLVLVCALASWSRPGEVSEDSVQNLPMSAAETLEELIMENNHWKKLGEMPNRR